MKQIEYVKAEEYIKSLITPSGQCDLGRFTIVNNALRDENEIGEILSATGAALVIDVITFSPQRLALLHTAAITQTEIRLRNEVHLANAVSHIHNTRVLPEIEKFARNDLAEIHSKIKLDVEASFNRLKNNNLDQHNSVDQLLQKTYQTVKTRIDQGLYTPGKYNPGEDIDSVVKKIVSDSLYKDSVGKRVQQIAEIAINQAIDSGEAVNVASKPITLERLSTHSGPARHTFVIAGPPACGKGSISAMTEIEAGRVGIALEDVVKVNTDFYRELVSSDQILGPNKAMHAALNNDESAMITDLTVERLKIKIEQGAAPHTLLDTVSVKQSKIDFGTQNKGTMKMKIMTLDPVIALERAQERGRQNGRFVPVQYMLTAHQRLGGDITSSLQNNVGKNVEIEIYDNQVPFGQLPDLVQKVNLQSQVVEIVDRSKYGSIYGRKFINADAHNASYIYTSAPRPDFSQLEMLEATGYELKYHKDVQMDRSLQPQLLSTVPEPDAQQSSNIYVQQTLSRTQVPQDAVTQAQLALSGFKLAQGAYAGIKSFVTRHTGAKISQEDLKSAKKTLKSELKKISEILDKKGEPLHELCQMKRDEVNSLSRKDPRYEQERAEYDSIKALDDARFEIEWELEKLQEEIKALGSGARVNYINSLKEQLRHLDESTQALDNGSELYLEAEKSAPAQQRHVQVPPQHLHSGHHLTRPQAPPKGRM